VRTRNPPASHNACAWSGERLSMGGQSDGLLRCFFRKDMMKRDGEDEDEDGRRQQLLHLEPMEFLDCLHFR
jgi:hypothetical protein